MIAVGTRPGISAPAREEMREAMADITESPEWSALAEHHAALAGRHLRELFADDPERAGRMTATAGTSTWTTPSTARRARR